MALIAGGLAGVLLFHVPHTAAQTEKTRPVKTQVAAEYPVLARRSNIAGTVKLQVVVAPDGHVKKSKVIGGNPVLVQAAMDAVKRWEFAPAKQETTEVVEFMFAPQAEGPSNCVSFGC
jgi:TonB family protein